MVEKQDNIKMSKKHKYFCKIASDLAKKSDVEKSKHGSVIVDGKKNILGFGYNKICKQNSCHSTHAEIAAILDAMKKHGKKSLTDSILYVVRIPNNDVKHELNYKPNYSRHNKKDNNYNYTKYSNTSYPIKKNTKTKITTKTKTYSRQQNINININPNIDTRTNTNINIDTRQNTNININTDTKQNTNINININSDTRQNTNINTNINTRQEKQSKKTKENNICYTTTTNNKTNKMIMSKPCEHCTKFIIENKIKIVYYSID